MYCTIKMLSKKQKDQLVASVEKNLFKEYTMPPLSFPKPYESNNYFEVDNLFFSSYENPVTSKFPNVRVRCQLCKKKVLSSVCKETFVSLSPFLRWVLTCNKCRNI